MKLHPRAPVVPPTSIADAMRKVHTKRQLQELFNYLSLRPRKALGQNFLVDPNLLEFIVRAGEVGPNDLVLDIGCGTGLLTAHIADAAPHGKVIGVEVDRGLLAICSRYLEGRGNVELVSGDALASKHALSPALLEAVERAMRNTGGTPVPPELKDTGRMPVPPALRVVSNLPYSVASLLVPNLLESGLPLALMIVTVQKEVGERMAASPGSGDYGALSLVVQAHATAEILRSVAPEVFWPRPKVTSCLLRIAPDPARRGLIQDYGTFRELIRSAFAYRRKTLANALAASKCFGKDVGAEIQACGLAPTARAEEVDLAGYVRLANHLAPRRSDK